MYREREIEVHSAEFRAGAVRLRIAEYREVLLRKKIRASPRLNERDVEALLIALATNAIVREP